MYKEMVEALARWHNSVVDVMSDEEYRPKGESAWRWIRLVEPEYSMTQSPPCEAVYSGAGAVGSEEDAYREFIKAYVSKESGLRFMGEYDGRHGSLILAGSVEELRLKMETMGLV